MGSHGKLPRVCFGVAADVIKGSDDQLPRMLAQRLSSRFESSLASKTLFFPSWSLQLRLETLSYTIAAKKSAYDQNEWVLIVGPSQIPSPLQIIRGQSTGNSSELLHVSCEIHTVLDSIVGISAIRWYFEDSHGQTAAVATPEQLPWN